MSADDAALVLTFMTLLVSWLLFHVSWLPAPLSEIFTPEHVSFFSMYDSSPQRIAHKALLALVALACGASLAGGKVWLRFIAACSRRPASLVLAHIRGHASLYLFGCFCMYVFAKPPGYPLWFSAPSDARFALLDAKVSEWWRHCFALLRWEAAAHPYALLVSSTLAAIVIGYLAYKFRAWSPFSRRTRWTAPTGVNQLTRRWLVIAAASVALLLANPTITILIASELTIVFLVYSMRFQLSDGCLRVGLWTALIAYVCFLMIPGLVQPLTPTLPTPEAPTGLPINYIELHYAMTLGAGDRLALGRALFDGATPYYGLLLPLILGGAERAFGMLDFGAHIRVVQVLNLIFVFLAIAAYRIWKPRHPLFTFVPLLLVLPWLHSSHLGILHPNQSAWRFIGFPLAMLVVLSIRGNSAREGVTRLGCALALLTILNMETAIALGGGFFVFLTCYGEGSFRDIAGRIVRFLVAAAVALGVLLVAINLIQANTFVFGTRALTGQLNMLRTFGGGYGGLPMHTDPAVLWIIGHATYILLRAFLLRAKQKLCYAQSFRAAVATTLLIWGAYYANRPDPWNVWSYLFLYGFLIADYFDPRVWKFATHRIGNGFVGVPALVFALILLPMMLSINVAATAAVARSLRAEATGATASVSGIRVPAVLADELERKARYLREFSQGSFVYLTVHSFLMPLMSSVDNGLPLMDSFGEAFSRSEFDLVHRRIDDARPAFVLFDDPNAELAGAKDVQAFFGRMRNSLAAQYRQIATSSGWQIWQRND